MSAQRIRFWGAHWLKFSQLSVSRPIFWQRKSWLMQKVHLVSKKVSNCSFRKGKKKKKEALNWEIFNETEN